MMAGRPILNVFALAWCLCFVTSENPSNWNQQLSEMKTLITQLETKVSSMNEKLATLEVLKYAFQMNSIDNNMVTINAKIDNMAVQIASVKDTVRNLPTSQCTQLQNTQTPQLSRSSATDSAEVITKLDDYGRKLMQSHQDIKTASEGHHQSLSDFVEVVRSGFKKVIDKVDSLKTLEGQMSTIAPVVHQLSTTANFLINEVSNVATDVVELKTSVSNSAASSKALEEQLATVIPLVRDVSDTAALVSGDVAKVQTDITEIKTSVSNGQTNITAIKTSVSNAQTDITQIKTSVLNFSRTNEAFHVILTDVRNSLAFPVNELARAMDDSKRLQSEMNRLTDIGSKVVEASSLSSRLLALESLQSVPARDREMAQNLTNVLLEVKNVTAPLFLSMVYDLHNIQALMGDSFRSLANRTQCRSDETVKLEIARLKESVSQQRSVLGLRSDDVFDYCQESIEDLVLKNRPDLKIPLLRLLSHLKILFSTIEERDGSNTQDLEEPLRSLLG